MAIMFDSISLETVPNDAPAVAGYTAGYWPTYAPFVARFPKLAKQGRIVSIAIQAGYDADALDIEHGDATPDQAPGWVERQLARGLKRPILYSSLSDMPAVLTALANHGIHRSEVRVWTAHLNGEHLCTPACGMGFNTTADATQWTFTAMGRNLDRSLTNDQFFKPSAVVFNAHYDWFIEQPDARERSTVQAYDRLRDRSFPFVIAHRHQLGVLRLALESLADRVAHEAISHPTADNHPSWNEFHRGWRYQQLQHRSEGRRLT